MWSEAEMREYQRRVATRWYEVEHLVEKQDQKQVFSAFLGVAMDVWGELVKEHEGFTVKPKQYEFADFLGISHATMSDFTKQKYIANSSTMKIIADRTGLVVYDAAGQPRPMPKSWALRIIASGVEAGLTTAEEEHTLEEMAKQMAERNRSKKGNGGVIPLFNNSGA